MLKSHNKTIFEALGRHPIHPFPARMAPGIALDALSETEGPIRVLDPMTGSGTVLAVARANGHKAIGVDLDPLAVLLAGVWTRTVNAEEITDKADEVLSRARSAFPQMNLAAAYPTCADDETRQFIRYWFDPYARRQLATLATAISRVRAEAIRDALWCGFSRLIITKSAGASLAMDLAHSRPHKSFGTAPVKPFNRFAAAVRIVVSNCPQHNGSNRGPTTTVKQGDARKLAVDAESIDLVLTSPPYLNAIDYMRCSKFSLVWMGYSVAELRDIRAESVGTEASSAEAFEAPWVRALIKQLGLTPELSTRGQRLLAQYVWDMERAMSEVSRVLRKGGRAVFVVGDSTVRGTFVSNSSIVVAVAERRGLQLRARQSRNLPANRRYLPPPKRNGSDLDGRMRREVVLEFNK